MDIESVIQQTTQSVLGIPVFPFTTPQSVGRGNFVMYTVVDTEHLTLLSGQLAGVATSRIQFTVLCPTLADVETYLEQIRLLWEGYRGTIQGVVIMGVWQDEEPVVQEYRQEGSDSVVFMGDFDLMFKVRE